MTANQAEARGGLGTVRNAVLLLELLADGPVFQQLTELADRSGLSLPTTHRLLRSLVIAGLVTQDPRSSRYGLGPELARLSHRYLARLPILGALSPYLIQLRDTLHATIEVHLLVRDAVVCVDQVDGSDSGAYRRSHTVHPALDTPSGRLLVARAEDETWRDALAGRSLVEAEEAQALRADWAVADRCAMAGEEPGSPTYLAVPVGTEAAAVALVALLPAGAAEGHLEMAAGQLTRAARAAERAVGHA
ncbi:MAG: helix-turn-helix domain-containing protein [Austwickia sp.]|jgi:IclR family acetate operon transcriptional repressor|nr:helix-turn-helix domain-containing protein [Austwickia sp.]MBK8435326.1 helix-turn-helix domain-containing protein [Austwickia sp.]MBK9101125.1 helix-turn-helix domain-containing protein [Austwickia sp.]